MPRLSLEDLANWASELLEGGGATREEARVVGPSLALADALGYASHGVMRIPFYLQMLSEGEIVSGAKLELLKDQAAVIVADGGWGFGRVQMGRLLDASLARVTETGVVAATLRHSSHIGRLGEYCEQAARAGYVAYMVANTHGTARRVAPPGGVVPRLGTNPLAYGVPADPHPLVLDFSTSVTAEGKVRVHKIAGTECPPGWLLDSTGRPTTDPNALYDEPQGTILPFGGEQPYKGFGLALIVDVLAGALSGGRTAREVPLNPKGNCVFLLLLDPAAFGGRPVFESEVGQLLEFVRGCPRAAGVDRIRLAGDPEQERLRAAQQAGVEVNDAQWSVLVELSRQLEVSLPTGIDDSNQT